ncbi:D123-domain-containing protein [Scheffersomyces xylosifermentans]|uniref:D123-domain-containing protein n=1 Tax=Scheffersomyces xylosifermentans TaxID=1304137 RepID=UPI00315DB3A2
MTKQEYTVFEDISVSPEEILACSYSKWYPHLKDHTVDSEVIRPLPKEFLEYLASDSIKLPAVNNYESNIELNSDNEYSDWEQDENDSEQEEEHDPESETKKNITVNDFKPLHDTIISKITKLGGAVTPKLNWSAPKDAKWMMPDNTIRCNHVNDVYLLLNSSDHIVDDLDFPFAATEEKPKQDVEYELVLRKWLDVNPALEFRVFVKDHKIIGISQRDLNHYIFLESLQDKLNKRISEFMYETVIPNLDTELGLDKYIVDVYIPRPFTKTYIVDVNPFTRKSDPLLFTWHELLTIDTMGDDEDNYEFRLINETNVGRFAKKEYSESQVPFDVVDASINTDAMVELAREWNTLQLQQDSRQTSE